MGKSSRLKVLLTSEVFGIASLGWSWDFGRRRIRRCYFGSYFAGYILMFRELSARFLLGVGISSSASIGLVVKAAKVSSEENSNNQYLYHEDFGVCVQRKGQGGKCMKRFFLVYHHFFFWYLPPSMRNFDSGRHGGDG